MTIHWINVLKSPPENNELVLVYVRGGYALAKMTKDGWKFFNGYSEVPDEEGCMQKFSTEGWPPEYWAKLTRP